MTTRNHTQPQPSSAAPGKASSVWTSSAGVFLFATISCFLWGSAFPCIKVGYGLFGIPGGDAASQMLFAGTRFFLAGIGVIVTMSLIRRRPLLPKRTSWGRIVVLSLFQTTLQYLLFYYGMAHASGVGGSIVKSTNTFFCVLIAALVFHLERLTPRKVLGCALGFLGVLLVTVTGTGQMGFTLAGEGVVLVSTLAAATSSSLIQVFSRKDDPVMMSGWQFVVGGLTLIAVGLAGGGRLQPSGPEALVLLAYMAFISAGAYTLWSVLLSHNPVSRVTIYGFANPVFGVILSAIILGEADAVSPLMAAVALALVAAGTIIVNMRRGDAPFVSSE